MLNKIKSTHEILGIVGWPSTTLYGLIGSIAAGYPVLLTGSPGSYKTKFIESLGAALGKKTRIYDVDKLSFEVLQGELNPEFVGQTAKSLDRIASTLSSAKDGGAPPAKPTGSMFINAVTDYEMIGWDEVLRGDPATQQNLLLNIMQSKVFQNQPVKATQISCTNTGFNELYEFNEALLNRYAMIFRCPSFVGMPADVQDELIDNSGHNKKTERIKYDKDFAAEFDKLVAALKGEPSEELNRMVKNFMKHLKQPLATALGERFSGRLADNIAKVLYTAFLTYMMVEGVKFKDFRDSIKSLRDVFRDTFMSTVYLEDLDATRRTQVRNAFHLAFTYSFDALELTLRDRLLSVNNFLVNCEDFAQHIDNVSFENQDTGGVAVFLDRLKKECVNDEPRRYIIYKWLGERTAKRPIKAEKDTIDPMMNNLQSMDKKMAKFATSNARVDISSDKIDSSFLDKCKAAASSRIFATSTVDTSTFAALVATIQCFSSEDAQKSYSQEYVMDLYTLYSTLKRV